MNFLRDERQLRFVGGANNCTTCENPTLADLALLISDNKLTIYHLKRVFCGVCIEKGARSFVGKNFRSADLILAICLMLR